MDKQKPLRIKYRESGGGWGNPLMGRVFDSEKDVPVEALTNFMELVEQCDLSKSGELQGQPPTDCSTFELSVEEAGKTTCVIGDMQRADDQLRNLIGFIRKHSRKEIVK